MELFFLRHSDWEAVYNCSGMHETMPLEETREKFQIQSLAGICLCALYYTLYVPCILSIWRHHRNNPCYTLLLYIGLVDMSVLWVLGFLHGWMTLQGWLFCKQPVFMYFSGAFLIACWVAESTADLLLAINRCMEIICPQFSKKLFEKKRMHFWLMLCTIYAIYWCTFNRPFVFSALFSAYFYNPFMGFRQEPPRPHNIYFYHNLIIASGTPTIYFVFFLAILIKHRELKAIKNFGQYANISKAEKMTFLQIFLISSMNAIGTTIYVIMQDTIPPQWLITMAQFIWLHIHGFPPVIYLSLNKTIGTDCKIMVKVWFKKIKNTVNPT